MTTLGDRIKKLREERNLTQTELSQILGMKTYTTVSKWESNDNFPKGKDLKILAELFDTSSDYLLGLSNDRKFVESDISTIYNQLTDHRKQKVYNFAEKELSAQNQKIASINRVKEKDSNYTLAAHSADPTKKYTNDDIKNIKSTLAKARKKYEDKNK